MSLFSQYREIRQGEWNRSLLLSAFFFLVIATFWILKPLKRGLLIHHFSNRPIELLGLQLSGAESEQAAKVLNMLCALLLSFVFTVLVRKYKRQRLVWIFAAVFTAAFAAFAALIPRATDPVVWSFYVFGDMFNTVMVVLFWAFTNDISSSEQAKRTYGLIGLGGVVGGFAGSTIVNSTVENLSRPPLLLLCIVPMALIAGIAWKISRQSGAPEPKRESSRDLTARDGFQGARLVLASRYLLLIAGLVCVYEVTSNVIDFQLASVVEKQISEPLKKDAFFAQVGQLIGVTSIAVQALLTGFVMTRFGVRVALLFLPVSIALGATGFLVTPTLLFAAILSASDNALHYSINQSAKESLYSPIPADVNYKAKAFIDMFVQRAAKACSVVINLAAAAIIGAGMIRWLGLFTLAMVVVWIVLVIAASAEFRKAARQEKKPSAAETPELAPAR